MKMSYAPIEINGEYFYTEQQILNMLINIYEVKNEY